MSESLGNQHPNDILENHLSSLESLQQETSISDETVSVLKNIFPEEVKKDNSWLFLILSVYYEQSEVYYKAWNKATALLSCAIQNYSQDRSSDEYNLNDFQWFLVEEFFRIEESDEVVKSEIDAVISQTNLEMEVMLPDLKKLDDAILAFQKRIYLSDWESQLFIQKIRESYLTDNTANNIWVFTILTSYYDAEGKSALLSLVDAHTTAESLLDYLLDTYFLSKEPYLEEISTISPETKPTIISPVSNKIAWLQLQSFDRKISEAREFLDKEYVLTADDNTDIISYNLWQKPAERLYVQYANSTNFPDQLVIDSYRQKKWQSLDASVSDVDLVDKYDMVPSGVMKMLNIKDVTKAKMVKKFRYATFLSFVDKNIWSVARDTIKWDTSNDMIDTALLKLFKSNLFGDTKMTKWLQSPDDVAVLLSYYLINGNMPKDPLLVLQEFWAAKDVVAKETSRYIDGIHQWKRERWNYDIAKFQWEKKAFVEAEVDKIVDAIKHPKGWFDIEYIVTAEPTEWKNNINFCGLNSCITIRNFVKAEWIARPIKYLWAAQFDEIQDVIDSGMVPILRWDVIDILKSLKKYKLGEMISSDDPSILGSLVMNKLPYLATKYNNSVFEIYFNTSGPVLNNKTGKYEFVSKAHRAHIVLGPDGVRQTFDPHYNPAWWLSKRKWFPVEVFFEKVAKRIYKKSKETTYEIVVNTPVQYGHLSDETIKTLADGNYLMLNNDAHDLLDKELQGEFFAVDLTQYEQFVPADLIQTIDENIALDFNDLEKAFPNAQYEILESIFLTVESIDNPFIRSMVIEYLKQWDVFGLEKELAPDQEPSGILDQNVIHLLEESFIRKNTDNDFPTVWLSGW